jgi:hypothetical protein
MKKLILFIIIFSKVTAQTTFKNSQEYNGFYSYNSQNFYLTVASVLSQKKLKSYCQTSVKNQKEFSYEEFDERGRTIEVKSKRLAKNFKIGRIYDFSHQFFEYDKFDNMKLKKSKNEKGNIAHQNIYFYRGKNMLDSSIVYTNELKSNSYHITYMSNNKPIRTHFYKYKKGKKINSGKYEFEYYENGDRKQTRAYNGKNKITNIWNFECDDKGKLEIKSNTTQICKNSGFDNNGKQFEATFQKHKDFETKTVSTFYKLSDSINHLLKIEKYTIYKGKEEKTSLTHFADSLEPYYEYVVYNNNKPIFSDKTIFKTYLAHKKVIESKVRTHYVNDKINYCITESYNDNGLPQEQTSKNSHGRVVSKTLYSFFGDSLYKQETYNNKGKLTNSIVTKLIYFN